MCPGLGGSPGGGGIDESGKNEIWPDLEFNRREAKCLELMGNVLTIFRNYDVANVFPSDYFIVQSDLEKLGGLNNLRRTGAL